MLSRFIALVSLISLISAPAMADKAKLEGVINLNTATPEELSLIPGVGPARIRNILAYRKSHPFRTVDELARIKGIGRKTVRRLRVHLATSGPTTAERVLRAEATFVGPPPVEDRSASPQHITPAVRPPLPAANPIRDLRGGTSRSVFPRAAGNHCLPPP